MKFYCLGLGIEPAQIWNNGQGQALILNMGNAILEIFDEKQAQTIDQIEAGNVSAVRSGFLSTYDPALINACAANIPDIAEALTP